MSSSSSSNVNVNVNAATGSVNDGEGTSTTSMPSGITKTTNNSNNIKPRRIIRRRPNHVQQTVVSIDPKYLQEVLQASNLPIDVYSFEIERTVQRCVALNVSHIALQMPEGLLLYATVLVDVLQKLILSVNTIKKLVKVSILSDVTYGACCIDDITASQLGCELLIHYGHSCLVPIQHTTIPVQYVFVEIQFYVPHLVQCLMITLFPPQSVDNNHDRKNEIMNHQELSSGNEHCTIQIKSNTSEIKERIHLYLLGTIQFRHALVDVQEQLLILYNEYVLQQHDDDDNSLPTLTISIPQCKPLSPGEVLGCTSPILNTHLMQPVDPTNTKCILKKTSAVVCFIADGRFHLESTMIANHNKIDTFYRYDPYSRILSIEAYGTNFFLYCRGYFSRSRSYDTILSPKFLLFVCIV
jgi:2-(3-amino-3-carboxypropyl)histidine synthase